MLICTDTFDRPLRLTDHLNLLATKPAPRKAFTASSLAAFIAAQGARIQAVAERIARVVSHTAGNSRPVLFLTGAKARPAGEDATVFAWMSAQFPGLQRVEATSMSEWLQTIATASCLVSGRFHHTIAAAMLGTPLIVLPSNTPKVSAVCDMLDLAPPLAGDGPQLDDLVAAGLQLALAGGAPVVPAATRESIRQLATNNFTGL